jgi:hypothetical protein
VTPETQRRAWLTPKLHVTDVKEFTNGQNRTDFDNTVTPNNNKQNKGKG